MAGDVINYKYFPLDEELKKLHHPQFVKEHVFVEGCMLPVRYRKSALDILEFEVRDDDIFVSSFPKCGTTWTQEMVWCIGNDLDFETAKRVPLQKRFPFLEMSSCVHFPAALTSVDNSTDATELPDYFKDSLEYTKNLQGRRFIKTHLPLQLLPKQLQTAQRNAKIVYVARDPRDACVSYYHHYRLLHGYTGDLSSFVKLFLRDAVVWAPFWQHVLGYWNIRHEPNMLFITYEEMKRDLPAVIERVATFLDKTLSPDQVSTLAHHLSFDSMKNNPAVNHTNIADKIRKLSGVDGNFIRSGQSGIFLNDLSNEEIELLNAWCKDNLRGSDYVLPKYK